MKRSLRIKDVLFVWRAFLRVWPRSRTLARLTYLALTVSVSGGIGCQRPERSTAQNVAQAESPPNSEELESLTTILHTVDADLSEPQRVVIRDSVSWTTMWRKLVGRYGTRPVPHVAFDSSLVVVAATGGTFSGHSIRIDSAKVQGAELIVYIRETIHEPCGQTDMMVTYPADAVKVRRAAEAVRFVNDSMVWKCP